MTDEQRNREEAKKELRNKYASTFKIFDDEVPSATIEKPQLTLKSQEVKETKEFQMPDIDVADGSNQKTKQAFTSQSASQNISQNVLENTPQKAPIKTTPKTTSTTPEPKQASKNTASHYKVSKFFMRTFISLLDQTAILALTALYFMVAIKPNMMEIKYQSFEAIVSFMIHDSSNFQALVLGYFMIMFLYYTAFNLLFKSTPFMRLFGYKIYRKDQLASAVVLMVRNVFLIPLNLVFLLFPFLFIMVSDDRQSLYDKLFKTYILKEN